MSEDAGVPPHEVPPHEVPPHEVPPHGAPEEFDVRTVVYLRSGEDPPDLGEEASTALHHAHLAYLHSLWERGLIAVNGPLLDKSDDTIRGMSLWTVPPDEARAHAEQDPAVLAGRFRVDTARWAVAAGRIAFPERDEPVGERIRFEDL